MRPATRIVAFVLFIIITGCAPVRIPNSETKPPTTAPPTSSTSSRLLPPLFAPPTPTAPKPQVLRINLTSHPDLLDPQRASTNGEVAVLQLAYEGLTHVDETGRVLPGAADAWEFSADGKTLTFHLRENLKRADGSPITAQDFEFALKHALDPRIGAADVSFLDDIHGALAAYSMDYKSRPEDIQKALDNVGVRTVDDSTLVITFDQATGFWPIIASTWIGYPTEKAKVENDPDGWWLRPNAHNGNGPFRISDIQEQFIKLEPNPNYWAGKPKLDRIEFYWIADPAAAVDAYRKGDVDVTRLTLDMQPMLDPQLSSDVLRGPSAWLTFLAFNLKKSPFTDKQVRAAFSQALDREALVRDVLKGMGKPYQSIIPPGIPGFDEGARVAAYDPTGAVKTLVDAGYGTPDHKRVDCNKLGTVKLSFSNTPRNQQLFQFLAGNLTRVFACPVLLDPIDAGTYALLIKDTRTAPQVYVLTWQEEYPHPQNWLFLQTCSGVYATRISYCNKEFDAAFSAANQELDPERAIDKYKAAQKLLLADMAVAPLSYNENSFLIKPYARFLWDHRSTADNAFPGQFGTFLQYAIR